MRTWLNKSFGFSRSQYNGLLILIFLIFILKCTPYLYGYFRPVPLNNPNLLASLQKLAFLENHRERNFKVYEKTVSKKRKLFHFNPNTLDQNGWVKLGLSEKQAIVIINYLNKGGNFRRPEDLKKMYTISPDLYKDLYSYVDIPDQVVSSPREKSIPHTFEKKAPIYIEINAADSAALDQMRGIGGAFASRILKYRNRLGGFYTKRQLMEVYGLDSIKFAEIKDQFYIDASKIVGIKINEAEFADWKMFPYLNYKQMNAIIQYRKQHGPYKGKSDLAKVILLNAVLIEKISPYLIF